MGDLDQDQDVGWKWEAVMTELAGIIAPRIAHGTATRRAQPDGAEDGADDGATAAAETKAPPALLEQTCGARNRNRNGNRSYIATGTGMDTPALVQVHRRSRATRR